MQAGGPAYMTVDGKPGSRVLADLSPEEALVFSMGLPSRRGRPNSWLLAVRAAASYECQQHGSRPPSARSGVRISENQPVVSPSSGAPPVLPIRTAAAGPLGEQSTQSTEQRLLPRVGEHTTAAPSLHGPLELDPMLAAMLAEETPLLSAETAEPELCNDSLELLHDSWSNDSFCAEELDQVLKD